MKASGYKLDQLGPSFIKELVEDHYAIREDFIEDQAGLLANVYQRLELLEMEGKF